jgi:hypothetical protein
VGVLRATSTGGGERKREKQYRGFVEALSAIIELFTLGLLG